MLFLRQKRERGKPEHQMALLKLVLRSVQPKVEIEKKNGCWAMLHTTTLSIETIVRYHYDTQPFQIYAVIHWLAIACGQRT